MKLCAVVRRKSDCETAGRFRAAAGRQNRVVLPLGKATLNFNGMLTLNESGVLMWKALEQSGDRKALADVLMGKYKVPAKRHWLMWMTF